MNRSTFCPLLSPRVCSNSCLLTQWCHLTVSSSVAPVSSCPQSFPASGSLPVSQFFASGGQGIGTSASAPVLPVNIQDWFSLRLTALIFLQSRGLLRVFSSTTIWKHQFFIAQSSLWSNSHIQTWLLEDHRFDYMDLCGKVMSLLFIKLSRFIIAFFPRSKPFLISWLQLLSAVTLETKKMKSVTTSTFSRLFVMKWWEWVPWPQCFFFF